ncbi:uncharacterized protein MKZ38_002908 [Zalerion maritima]|uniref:Uncharacterized protein n=1 Tax=Zalerion maritima TaxID=339359 RepID=A0AAD5WS57_9PEZI|nr:uncharacterized protein MKZ38_002908 [Zalerion maritima]
MLQPRLTTLVLPLALAQVGAAMQPAFAEPTGVLRFKKRATCPSTYPVSCGTDDNTWCCASGWICSTDADGDAACCPSGAMCTGSVPEATSVSYVANSYYPFPYISTSFSNAGVCSAAYQTCSSNYEMCTVGLEGTAAYGVTISVAGGGGTTVTAAGASLAVTSAESICSSLSSVACHGGLDESVCEQTGTVGVFVVAASSPKPHLPAVGSLTAAALALIVSSLS